MMLVPWWRAGPWAAPLAGALAAVPIALVGTVLARGDRAFAVGALTAFAAAVVAVDALFASPLQVDAPFGNSPVGAGRFFGVGNIGSGFLVAGALVAGGLALERGGSRARRWVGAALAAAVVAGGAPPFGADVGGVLFAVPAYGVLLVGARRARIAARHVVLLAGAAVVAVALFAAVDLLRAAGSQTHLARSLAGQGIADEVVRKAGHALRTAIMPMTALVGVAAAVLPFLPRVPGRWRPRRGSYALLTAGVLGSLLNDSGLLVGAAVAAVAWPAAVLLAPESQDACATRAAPA
jgi:hypothetical protein